MHKIPERFERVSSQGDIKISWAWRQGWALPVFLSVWLVFWWAFIFLFSAKSVPKYDPELTRFDLWIEHLLSLDWWLSLFPVPLLHIIPGLIVLYVLLANLFNSSTLTIGIQTISLKHSPLPWKTPDTLNLSEVDSFEAESYTVKSKKGATKTKHAAIAVMRNKKRKKLLSFSSKNGESEVAYILQELNTRV